MPFELALVWVLVVVADVLAATAGALIAAQPPMVAASEAVMIRTLAVEIKAPLRLGVLGAFIIHNSLISVITAASGVSSPG